MAKLTSNVASLTSVLLIICYLQLISALPQAGDVRLNQNGDLWKATGVLEVYLNSHWMPVCFNEFNEGAAAAACRQLGYCTFESYRAAERYSSPVDESFTNVSCPNKGNYTEHGELHLLRCKGTIQQRQCTSPVYLNCKALCKLFKNNPYNGQVFLLDDNSYLKSAGILTLNYNNEQLPVCADHFSSYAAETVCRQLGYTGGNYTDLPYSSFSWNVGNITCQSESYPCLKNCSHSSYTQASCRNYNITCTFDFNKKESQSPGSLAECIIITQTQPSSNGFCSSSECKGFLAAFVICITIIAILGVVVAVLTCKEMKKKRNAEQELLNDGAVND